MAAKAKKTGKKNANIKSTARTVRSAKKQPKKSKTGAKRTAGKRGVKKGG